MTSAWSRRAEAVQAANDLLVGLHISQDDPVDVFGMCEDLGLWLVFKPLGGLLGAYVPTGAGGVLITTQRQVALQRYTAAHELGHWALGHSSEVALDDELCVLGRHPSEREQLAQLFAAHLLVPPPLAYGVLDRIGARGEVLSPLQAYVFAREVGVSYEAAVRHLNAIEVVGRDQMLQLLRARPLDLKTALGYGRKPADPRAEVWMVDDRWHQHRLAVNEHDEITVSLPENRTSGYRWVAHDTDMTGREGSEGSGAQPVAENYASGWRGDAVDPGSVLEVVDDRYVPGRATYGPRLPNALADFNLVDLAIGATGQRLLTFQARHPGADDIQLTYLPVYDREAEPAKSFRLTTSVEARRVNASLSQLLEDSPPPS